MTMTEKPTRSEPLAEAFPREQERLRGLLAIYHEIGPAGAFGHAAISAVLSRAERAAAEHDTVAMLRSYEEMRGCE